MRPERLDPTAGASGAAARGRAERVECFGHDAAVTVPLDTGDRVRARTGPATGSASRSAATCCSSPPRPGSAGYKGIASGPGHDDGGRQTVRQYRGWCIMCRHRPACPSAYAPDRAAARVVATHPDQGWSLLCNGVVLFDDTGLLLPDGTVVAPCRPPVAA
nr:MAG: hypothetical protein DIU60_18935 [Actinomycetota bacterium]